LTTRSPERSSERSANRSSERSFFGFVGNGETAALIAPNLAVSWLCLPRFDGTPVFARALDPRRGGALALRLYDAAGKPIALAPCHQRYQGDTALLETAGEGEGWRVEVLDYMPWGQHGLIREVRLTNRTGTDATVTLAAEVSPIDSRAFQVTVTRGEQATAIRHPFGTALIAWAPATQGGDAPGGRSPGPLHLAAGETATLRLSLAYGPDPRAAEAALVDLAKATAAQEAERWAAWLQRAAQPAVPPKWLASYRRSLITMKLLSYEPTGALLAAPTASFPAVPGGGDNWDYRYIWLRDGYYTAMTFNAAGLHDEAARFYDFAFTLQGEDGHWRQPLFTVDGGDPQEFIADDLAGPGGERPIRFGNAASGQLQLDNEGNIIHGLWFHYAQSGDRAALERHWDGVRRACEWTAANWNQVESGIWEIREYQGHWVHGKAMCYACLDAGARIATVLGHPDEADRWRRVAEAIRAEVVAKGWNEERQAYLSHYGSTQAPHLDISVLALVFYGLLPPDDPRVTSTVARMEKAQQEGGLMLKGGVCRYDWGAVPFYLPTLWLARYYLMAGRIAECDRLLQTCMDCATDLDLMAEHFDGERLEQWGNFPQAFSHEEVARLVLERGRGRSYYQD
jgi:GH15 family glucan-1,4-alpha-glucosidase